MRVDLIRGSFIEQLNAEFALLDLQWQLLAKVWMFVTGQQLRVPSMS